VEAANTAAKRQGWSREQLALAPRYLKEVGGGFAAVVQIHPGEGSTISSEKEVILQSGVQLVVSATYLPAERIVQDQGYRRAAVEISDPQWDIDEHVVTADRLDDDGMALRVASAMTGAMAAAEQFAVAHASPGAFAAAVYAELEDEFVSADDFITAPAVFAAAGLHSEAQDAIEQCRARTGSEIPDEFWQHLDQLSKRGSN
jgi:hypothetical protein